jgi:ABC-2 type transport system permease protein
MKIGTIAYYTFLQHIRDIRAVVAFILIPLVVVFAAGTALDAEFSPKQAKLVQVGFLNLDQGELGQAWQAYMNSEPLQKLLTLKTVTDRQSGEEAVRSGKLDGLLFIPHGLTDEWHNGGSAQAEYTHAKTFSPVLPVLDSFVRNLNKDAVLKEASLASDATSSGQESPLERITHISAGKIPRAMDYYGITLLFQCLLIGGMFGIFAVTKDGATHVADRFRAAPLGKWTAPLGKLIGCTLVLLSIALVVVLIFKYGFGINWSGNPFLILLVLLEFCLISVALGMFFVYLTGSMMIATLVTFFLSTLLTFAAEGFTRMENATLQAISFLAPGKYGQKVLFDHIYQGTLATRPLLQLTLYAALMVVLVMATGRRKQG